MRSFFFISVPKVKKTEKNLFFNKNCPSKFNSSNNNTTILNYFWDNQPAIKDVPNAPTMNIHNPIGILNISKRNNIGNK